MPFVIKGYEEVVADDTAWNEHSHPWHELLWNGHGASTVVVGSRVWCVTPTLGLWMPAGQLHSASGRGHLVPGPLLPARHGVGAARRTGRRGHHPAAPAPPGAAGGGGPDVVFPGRDRDDGPRRPAAVAPGAVGAAAHVPVAAADRGRGTGRSRPPADAGRLGVLPRVQRPHPDPGVPDRDGHEFRPLGRRGTGPARRAAPLRGFEVDVVADAVGYRSASAFGAAFRRTTGTTPGSFRTR